MNLPELLKDHGIPFDLLYREDRDRGGEPI